MKKFILIGHRKNQGKDTFAKMLAEHLGDAEIMSFADPIKQLLCESTGLEIPTINMLKNEDSSWRDSLKRIGSGQMIEWFGDNVWRDLLLKRAEKSEAKYIIIPDFRFLREEIEGSLTINVVRDDDVSDQHPSESELDEFDYDVEITNDCTLVSLDILAHNISLYVDDILTEEEQPNHKENMETVYGTNGTSKESIKKTCEETKETQTCNPIGRTEVGQNFIFFKRFKAGTITVTSNNNTEICLEGYTDSEH